MCNSGHSVRVSGNRLRPSSSHVVGASQRDNPGHMLTTQEGSNDAADVPADIGSSEALLKTGALQRAIFDSASFSSIATDTRGVIQIFNVGAERMLGYTAAEVVNKLSAADLHDPQEVIARAAALSLEFGIP